MTLARTYVSTADFRAPYDAVDFAGAPGLGCGCSAPPPQAGLGALRREMYDISNFRAPYDGGYYQDNDLMGLGATAGQMVIDAARAGGAESVPSSILEKLSAMVSSVNVPVPPSEMPVAERYQYLLQQEYQAQAVLKLLPAADTSQASYMRAVNSIATRIATSATGVGALWKWANDQPLVASDSELNTVIQYAVKWASQGVRYHSPEVQGVAVKAGVTPSVSDGAYRSRLSVFWAVTQLYQGGHLQALMQQRYAGASGLGAFQVPIGVAIGAAIFLAVCIIGIYAIYAFDSQVKRFCFDKDGNPRPENREACNALIGSLSPGGTVGSIVRVIMPWVFLGAAIYFLPTIVSKVKQARAGG